jgi:membrane protein
VGAIANVVPPLRGLIELILEEAADAAGAISIIGAVALIWGASRFVVAFEDAMARIFGGARRRGLVARNAVGVGAVLGLIGAALLGTFLSGLAVFLDAAEHVGGPVVGLVGGAILALVPTLSVFLAIVLVYRYVPVVAPTWKAMAPPAFAVAIALTVLTRVFVFLAPRLIGAAATIGAIATAFAALAWLALSFQAVLLGAAWVRERDPNWGLVSAGLEGGGSAPPP